MHTSSSKPASRHFAHSAAAVTLLALFVPGAEAAPLKAVQDGTATIAAAGLSTTATLTPAVDTTRAFLVFGVSVDTNEPRCGQVSGQITNSTTVTFQRADTLGCPAVTMKWHVAEFSSRVTVRRGTLNIGVMGNSPWNATLTPAVNLAKSFPIVSYRVNGGNFDANDFLRARLTSATNLELSAPCLCGVTPQVVEWQVVEYQDATVRTGDVSFTAAETLKTVPLAPAAAAGKSLLVYNYLADIAVNDIGDRLVRGRITGGGAQLDFDRGHFGAGVAIDLTWFLIEFSDATSVQHASEAFGALEATRPVAISAVVPGHSIALSGGGYTRGGRTPFVGDDLIGLGWFNFDLTGPTSLQITRGTIGATADVGWFVVEFDCDCPTLATTEGAGTITVTAPSSFQLRFNAATGGGIDEFRDLAEDPAVDLAGGIDQIETLFSDAIESGGFGIWYDNAQRPADVVVPGSKPQLDLLEATGTRVRVRAESPYFLEGGGPAYLPGIKAWSDYSVYPAGRVAYRLNRRTFSAPVSYLRTNLCLGVHLAGAPLGSWNAFSQSGVLGTQPPTDAFGLFTSDVTGARTDFLQIPHEDWTLAGHAGAPDNWVRFDSPADEYALIELRENDPVVIPSNTSESWDFLTYFKPTSFLSHADAQVTSRALDYRSPDPLSAIGFGSGWNENTADADFFNESEGVYTFNLNPASGLSFDMDGSLTTRRSPFFKIRQWRSLLDQPAVTLESSPLVKDLHYKADVKPITAAAFADAILWHSTLQNAASLTGTPDIGNAGTVGPGVVFTTAKYGAGAVIPSDADWIAFPTTDFDKAAGVLEFWFRPTWASDDGVRHDIAGFFVDATNSFQLQKLVGNTLRFRIVTSAGNSDLVVGATAYKWLADEWVHIRLQWYDALPLANQQAVFINREEPAHTDAAVNYDSTLLTLHSEFLIGNINNGSVSYAQGTYDEPQFFSVSAFDASAGLLARAGLVADAVEHLATGSRNATLSLDPVTGTRQGEFLYAGSDARFHGLNVVLATAGSGTANLQWQFWNGSSWADLEAVTGFGDTTSNLTRNGNLFWTADPPGWSGLSFGGGPDLYWVRAYVASGAYTTSPVEHTIKTDILLFQYCGDVTAANRTFLFGAPATTEVKLSSFGAVAGDASVQLEWRTGSELDNLGFHVYRALSESGPWTRLTSSLVPGLGSSAVGQDYSFRDTGLTNGTRYFYRLEDVDAASKATSHGPVSAVPVREAPGSAPGSDPADTSPKSRRKATASTCPDWVLTAYASSAGPDATTTSLRCSRHGDPEAVSLGVVSRSSRGATLELRTGGFYALHTQSGAGEPSGTVRVFVPGFDFPQDEKAAALPIRRALADAIVGRRVQLGGVRALEVVSFKGLVPAALGKAEMQVGRDGTVRPSRRAAGHGKTRAAKRFPSAELVTLLPSVFQGETKSAVVQIAPFRFDSQRQQLVLAKRVLVRLLFTGREAGESGTGSVGRAPGSRKPVAGELLARLHTTSRGLYAASFEQLFPKRQRGFAASQLRLERQGEPVAFHVEPASDSFGPGSRLYFFSDKTPISTDFSAEVSYALVRATDGLRMPTVSAAATGVGVGAPSTGFSSFETDRFYQPGLLDAPDPWLWEGLPSGATRVKPFSLGGTDATSAATAELDLFLQGASESGNAVDHHVSVSVNGVPVGEAQFAGKRPYRMSLSLPASLLREGANDLSLTNVADTGVSSYVFLDRFALAYPQAPSLRSGVFEGTWGESGTASLVGSSGPVVVLDVTAASGAGAAGTSAAALSLGTARWLAGLSAAGGSLRFQAEAGHRYLAVSQDSLLVPRVAPASPSTLRATTNQADYLLIAPQAFLAASEPLLQRRQEQGLTTRAVAFEEITDAFGHGQASAEAIKAFLAYAFHSWARPSPRYVLLLGDASYDPRNFIGTSQPSPLPALWAKTSYLWTVSDPQLAAVNGEDALPDLAIGRLPAATVEQAEALVQKLVAWEDSGQGLRGTAALVADNPDIAGDFEADVRDIAESYLPQRSELLLLSEHGSGLRPRILDALNGGLSYLNYVGHGGAAVWASENVWNSWDAASLQAQSQQPFLVTMNCLNGYFVAPAFDSLSESLLKADGRGAIAAFSPSGLSLDGPAHVLHRALLSELTRGNHERLGDAVLAAQKAYAETGAMPELLSIYHLFGDPAMTLAGARGALSPP